MPSSGNNAVWRGDASHDLLKPGRLPEQSVRLAITSPPYGGALDYDKAASDMDGGWYRGSAGGAYDGTDGWLDAMSAVFVPVYDALAAGGHCCIVIGDEAGGGRGLVPLPYLLLSRLLQDEPGWACRDLIIWNKVTGGAPRFGCFVQHPKPGNFYANMMHEHIIILRKDGGRRAGGFGCDIPLNRIIKREMANSVWNIAPVPPQQAKRWGHPAPFPLQIPYRLVMLYSKAGDLVLDPMCGSGQTLIAASMQGRRYAGMDLRQSYVDAARRRLAGTTKQDAIRLLGNWLVPGWHAEKWNHSDESGFLETAEADMSSMIPPGFSLTGIGKSSRDVVRLHYEDGGGRRMYIDARGSKLTRHVSPPAATADVAAESKPEKT